MAVTVERRFRHAIVCLTDYSDFRLRIRRADVECYALHKPPGKVPGFYVKVWKLLRRAAGARYRS